MGKYWQLGKDRRASQLNLVYILFICIIYIRLYYVTQRSTGTVPVRNGEPSTQYFLVISQGLVSHGLLCFMYHVLIVLSRQKWKSVDL